MSGAAQWEKVDAREAIHTLVDDMYNEGDGFKFTKDLVLKVGLMLSDIGSVGFKVENFNKANMAVLETNWPRIRGVDGEADQHGDAIGAGCSATYVERIWTPPDCNGRLDQDRWSQLLTYIRLRDAAGQRLRREPRWGARFHLKAPMTLANAMPVHTSGSGSDGVTVSPSPAICCNCRGGTSFAYWPLRFRPPSPTARARKLCRPRA
ncbi:hypothetical protein ILFOPFJJ_06417 [Ensifer psoraleae]|nr:hypothetical protein [Sinorhizobium psoraleae]